MSLSGRQQRFVDEYLANGGKAYPAALAAGYSEKYAKAQSHKLLDNVGIAEAIKASQSELKKELGITAEWKRDQLKNIIESCTKTISITKGKGEEATIINTMDDPKAAIAAIAELNKMDGDLAAIKTENKNENTHRLEDMSEEELNDRIAELEGKKGAA
ncbi:terminase small subunit [Endozoicomonas arenosclerae]|uniref:terminase small subunit n=1 Tax=Endozoicomonas arenosclerae TaxID=1633495 RepID=UPI0007804241|nr:terminase small subunit [Endozoicomonas arenosclerae]